MTWVPDQLSPETLEKYFRSGTVTTHRAGEDPEIFIRIDGPAQKISLLTPRTDVSLDTATLRRVSTGVEFNAGAEFTRLTLDARGMYAEAYGLLQSVVLAMRGGATLAAATSAAMTNMKALLAARPRISEESQVGLIGELLLLRSLLDAHDEYTVLDWWLGPLAEERDFAFSSFDAEVKTTLSEARRHVIHGVGQLEPSPGRALWLVSLQITRAGGDPAGFSLPSLIGELRDQLCGTRDRFNGHLAREGWDDDDAVMYRTKYVRRSSPVAYLVDDDFPAVTSERLRSTVPHANLVSDVSYRVDLSGRAPGRPGDPLDAFVAIPPSEEN